MLDPTTRATILKLHHEGLAKRHIARLLKISRNTVRQVLSSQSQAPPKIPRPEKAEPYRDEILDLMSRCKGNLVRVHEELLELGATMSYPALTAFCRRHGLGQTPIRPAGRYRFDPGQEIQHDTSPHVAVIGGKKRRVQSASAVLAYSRMIFFQAYPRFRRFECKVFLTEALRYFDGAPQVVMIDNTNVVVLSGTGAEMVPVPEMEAFSERFGFRFLAHAVGHADRSARVERPFHYIENNFFAGRTFADWQELNASARAWCDRVNGRYKRHLRARPTELYAVEHPALRRLPAWIPEPENLHHRIVDVYGYVTVHTNRYSVPYEWIGRQAQVRETFENLIFTLGRESVSHPRVIDPVGRRSTDPRHRPPKGKRLQREPPPELAQLLGQAPELTGYVASLKKKGKKPLVRALRQLLRLVREYPREPFVDAVREAEHYGLYDLDRLETMILRKIADDFFPYGPEGEDDDA